MELSVILPTHNPDPERLRRTLAGLRAQSLPAGRWESIVVNNASTHFPDAAFFGECAPGNLTVIDEPDLGLTAARMRGFAAARGVFAVLVDDDNILDPDYLEQVLAIFAAHPRLGTAGGRSAPEFAGVPAAWTEEFFRSSRCAISVSRNFWRRPSAPPEPRATSIRPVPPSAPAWRCGARLGRRGWSRATATSRC